MSLSKDVVIRLLGDASSAEKAIKSAADAAEVSVAAYRRAERESAKQARAAETLMRRQREMMDELGRGAMLAGAAILAGFAFAVKAAAEFDKAMSAAAAATKATAQELPQLRDAALEAGATTAYSATEAADAITELAKAGVETADILNGGLTGALDLAAAGQLDVATAAGIAATQMEVFGLSGQATSHVADLLAAGAGKAMGSVEDLAGALKYVGPVAAGMGVSIEETTGALALFASNGILGEQAGTSLRGVLSALTSPSQAAAKQMEALGISVFDAHGEFIGLDGVAGQLQGAMSDLTEEERSAALGRIFGNEQLTAARVLYTSGAKGVQEWTRAVNDSGFAQEQAAKLTDNLIGDVERLGGALSTALIEGGSGANDVLRFMTQALTGAIEGYTRLPDPIEGAVAGFAALTGAGLLVMGVIASLGVRIGEFRDRLEAIGPSGERASAALGGIGRFAARASIIVGVTTAIVGLGQAAMNAAADFFDLDDGASDVADALANIDVGTVVASLNELGDTGRSVGWFAETFGSARDAVRTLNRELANGDRSVGFRANVEALDQALAGMMASGQIDSATDAFGRLGREWVRQGGSVDDLLLYLPQYTGSLQDYARANATGADEAGTLTDQQRQQIEAFDEAALSVDDLKDALDRLNGAVVSQFDAEADWTLSLESVRDALRENGTNLDRNTEAGARNWQTLSASRDRANELATAIYNSTGSYDEMTASLQTSRDQLTGALVDMGLNEEQARQLAESIIGIPDRADTQADMDTTGAAAGRDVVLGMIETLNVTPATVQVKVSTSDFFNTMHAITTGTYTAQVGVKFVSKGSQTDMLNNFFGVPPKAEGGPVWPGQTFLVGEKGPELVQFGASGFVTPAGLTAQALAEARGAVAGTPTSAGVGIPVGSHMAARSAAASAAPLIDYDRLAAAVADGRALVNVEHMEVAREEHARETAERLNWLATTN